MILETEHSYEVFLVGNDFNEQGRLKPASLPQMIQYVADHHLQSVGLSTAALGAEHLAWVLVGMTVELLQPLAPGERLLGRTWHSETRLPFFRREMQFSRLDGEPVIHAASFSVLIDLATRRITRRDQALPIEGDGSGRFLLADLRPTFRELEDEAYQFWQRREIYNSHLDILGHVNNARYCEFAFDALNEQEKARPLRRLAINFVSELRLGDCLLLHKAEQDGDIYLQGIREADGKKSFAIVFQFDA